MLSNQIEKLRRRCQTKLNNYEEVTKPNQITTKMVPNQIK